MDEGSAAPLARAIGLGRAASELVAEEGPWLREPPGGALTQAIGTVLSPEARGRVGAASPEMLRDARTTGLDLFRILSITGEVFRLGFPHGTAGLGFLTVAATDPLVLRPILALVALLAPADARSFVDAFEGVDLDEWAAAANLAEDWLESHPEERSDAERRGLVAVLTDDQSIGDKPAD